MAEIKRGHAYFGKIVSKARGGKELVHFVVVVQDDGVTHASQFVVVVPVTSDWKGQAGARRAVALLRKERNKFLKHDSVVLCLQPILMEKSQLQKFEHKGQVDRLDMIAIGQALSFLFGLTALSD